VAAITVQGQTYEIEGILFDKDGTLLEFSSLWVSWAKQLLDDVGEKANLSMIDRETLANELGFNVQSNNWDPKGPLCIGSLDQVITIVSINLYRKGFSWDESIQMATESWEKIEAREDWKSSIRPVDGLYQFLRCATASSLKLGVVTSDNYDQAIKHLRALKIESYFSAIIGHDQVARGKPYPDMVEVACKKMNMSPERTLMIGDSNGDMILGRRSKAKANIGIVAENKQSADHLIDANHIIKSYHHIHISK